MYVYHCSVGRLSGARTKMTENTSEYSKIEAVKNMRVRVFWGVRFCQATKLTDVSEKRNASISGVKEFKSVNKLLTNAFFQCHQCYIFHQERHSVCC
jgi:hypothetical protein